MERLVIAEILKPQGIRGELKLKTFTDSPEDVKQFGELYIDGTPYKILSFRVGVEELVFSDFFHLIRWHNRVECYTEVLVLPRQLPLGKRFRRAFERRGTETRAFRICRKKRQRRAS